jgi:molybdate-binding protein
MASCDPTAALLAGELARAHRTRLLCFSRSSRAALELLERGVIHVAGVHFGSGDSPDANPRMASEALGAGYRLLPVALWDEGLTVGPGVGGRSARSIARSRLRWVGREVGSAARDCQDELLQRSAPRRLARDHRGVAEAIRSGWADAGVCLRFVAHDAGLNFFSVRQERYDLCFSAAIEHDPRIVALIQTVQSLRYRRLLDELPGLASRSDREIIPVA